MGAVDMHVDVESIVQGEFGERTAADYAMHGSRPPSAEHRNCRGTRPVEASTVARGSIEPACFSNGDERLNTLNADVRLALAIAVSVLRLRIFCVHFLKCTPCHRPEVYKGCV